MLTENKNIKRITRAGTGFFGGIAVLSVSTLICKVIGLLFKIPIINIVGIDGMASFSAAYNIYMLLNSISAAGLPVALSILISKNKTSGNISGLKKIYNVALLIFVVLGATGTLVLYFCSDRYADFIEIPGASAAVKAISPALFFICISGAVRGYLQGCEFMLPTAVSQLIESLGKLILGVGFAAVVAHAFSNSDFSAAAALIGLSSGVMLSSLYLLRKKRLFDKNANTFAASDDVFAPQKVSRILSELVYIALPITLSSCITSLTSLADTVLIVNRLVDTGFSHDAAVTLYSSYTNLAIPLFNLPPALITAVGISVVPSLTSAITDENKDKAEKLFSSSLRITLAFSLPAAAGMAVFASPILNLIFPGETQACNFASPLLSVLAPAIIFSCLITICNAVLQAYYKPALPIVSMGAGALVKAIAEFILVGSNIGIYGAPISTLACTFTILVIDVIFILIYTPHGLNMSVFWKTAAATAFSVGTAAIIHYFVFDSVLNSALGLFFSIIITIILYALFALLFGVVVQDDLLMLPFGKRVAVLLKKIGLLRY